MKAADILRLTRTEQSDSLAGLELDDLKALLAELVQEAKARSLKPSSALTNQSFLSTVKKPQLLQQMAPLLKLFPEVGNKVLAIDRKFKTQEEKLDAIIDDINNCRLPSYRYWELLKENLYSTELVIKDIPFEQRIDKCLTILEELNAKYGNGEVLAAMKAIDVRINMSDPVAEIAGLVDDKYKGTGDKVEFFLADITAELAKQLGESQDIKDELNPLKIYKGFVAEHESTAENITEVKSSRTFLAYSLAKLPDLRSFFQTLKAQLGEKQFDFYMTTPLFLAGKEEEITIDSLYLTKHESLNTVEFALNDISKNILNLWLPKSVTENKIDISRIDTHNISSHRSADESHIKAFSMMLDANPNLEVVPTYDEYNADGELPRKISVTPNHKLARFVQTNLKALQADIGGLIGASPAKLYDVYLRASDKDAAYDTLTEDAKENADKKIKGLLFQANAAKRFMDNMIKDHKCNGGRYEYMTNAAASCGLTMEQMVASVYWAGKDTANFKEKAITDADVLFSIIRQLYDMRRGYNIDFGSDNPDENKFPDPAGPDDNRCHGGCVNSLASALKAIHTAYNVKLVTRENIEKYVRDAYVEIVKENLKYIQENADEKMLESWSTTGQITGEIRETLQAIFDAEYRGKFEEFKGYIVDDIFKYVINNGLNNVPMPPSLKQAYAIENMNDASIYTALMVEKIPLLHLDKDKGYEGTLDYLSKLPYRGGLISTITQTYGIAPIIQYSSGQNLLLYLSRSGLADEYGDMEILNIRGKPILLKDIVGLGPKELARLVYFKDVESIESILEHSIEQDDYPDLFAFYALKIGFTTEDIVKLYGAHDITVLKYAAEYGYAEIVRNILATPEGKESLKLENRRRLTPVHYAADQSNVDVMEEMIKWPQGREALKNDNNLVSVPLGYAVQRKNVGMVKVILSTLEGRESLNMAAAQGTPPFYRAATHPGCAEIMQEMLKTPEGIACVSILDHDSGNTMVHYAVKESDAAGVKALLTTAVGEESLLAQDRRNGYTPLHIAVKKRRDMQMVEAILEKAAGQKSLSIVDELGNTPLHYAVKRGDLKMVEKILEFPEGRESLNIRNSRDSDTLLRIGDTPLHLAAKEGNVNIVKAILAKQEGIAAASDRASLAERIDRCSLILRYYIINKLDKHHHTAAYQIIVDAIGEKDVDIDSFKREPIAALTAAINKKYPDEPGVDKVELFLGSINKRLAKLAPKDLQYPRTPLEKYKGIFKLYNPPLYVVKGTTPLHNVHKSFVVTTQFGSKDEFTLLWLLGVNPNLLDDLGHTPLIAAAREGNIEIMKDLMLHGADPYMKDRIGKTLTHHMSSRHKDSITKLLSNYEAMENQFKNNFEKQFVQSIKTLGKDPKAADIAKAFDATLKEAYKPTSAERAMQSGFATPKIVENCQLHFVHKFLLRLQSMFSASTYEDLKAMKLADRIYTKIQYTKPFRNFIAQTEVGKEAVKSYEDDLKVGKTRLRTDTKNALIGATVGGLIYLASTSIPKDFASATKLCASLTISGAIVGYFADSIKDKWDGGRAP